MFTVDPEREGEIFHVGQVLDPAEAVSLGNTILQTIDKYDPDDMQTSVISSRNHRSPSEEQPYLLDPSLLDAENQHSIDQSSSVLVSTVRNREQITEPLQIVSGILVGAIDIWHIDGEPDYRMLINLGREETTLHVATAWDKTITTIPKPAKAFTSLDLKSGEGVVIDNMCPRGQQVPHAGIRQEGRVLLRHTLTLPA